MLLYAPAVSSVATGRWLGVLVAAVFCMAGIPAPAADWPMYRYDIQRSASSPQQLSDRLQLQWVRQLPERRPLFGHAPRSCPDLSHEPIVMGKTLFHPPRLHLRSAHGTAKAPHFTDHGPGRHVAVDEVRVTLTPQGDSLPAVLCGIEIVAAPNSGSRA